MWTEINRFEISSYLASNPSFAAEVTLSVAESNNVIILTKLPWK